MLHLATTITDFFNHCYITIAWHHYNCWFILTLLQSTTFVCIIAVVNFCMHHFKWQPIYALMYYVPANFVSTIVTNKFCMHCCNWPIQHRGNQKHRLLQQHEYSYDSNIHRCIGTWFSGGLTKNCPVLPDFYHFVWDWHCDF